MVKKCQTGFLAVSQRCLLQMEIFCCGFSFQPLHDVCVCTVCVSLHNDASVRRTGYPAMSQLPTFLELWSESGQLKKKELYIVQFNCFCVELKKSCTCSACNNETAGGDMTTSLQGSFSGLFSLFWRDINICWLESTPARVQIYITTKKKLKNINLLYSIFRLFIEIMLPIVSLIKSISKKHWY